MLFPIKQGLFKYDIEDHYAILGAPLDADSKQIRDRYLKIAFQLHPDTCKAKTDSDRRLANQLLSKLVNPAYKILSTERNRAEFQLILAQVGKNLLFDADFLSSLRGVSQQLSQATQNADLLYHRLSHPLLARQYEDLAGFFEITSQISELNLVYLGIKQGQVITPPLTPSTTPQPSPQDDSKDSTSLEDYQTIQPRKGKNDDKPATEKAATTPLEKAFKRASEQMENKRYSQSIAELQEILKNNPQNSRAHALIGWAYLKTNQETMAKVHINKAIAIDPTDPIAKQAKQALNKISPPSKETHPEKPKSGLFNNIFGGPKK